jgi:hypothetical protein
MDQFLVGFLFKVQNLNENSKTTYFLIYRLVFLIYHSIFPVSSFSNFDFFNYNPPVFNELVEHAAAPLPESCAAGRARKKDCTTESQRSTKAMEKPRRTQSTNSPKTTTHDYSGDFFLGSSAPPHEVRGQ